MRQSRIDNPEKQRKPKRQSRIDNPEKTEEAIKRNGNILGTQETGQRQTKQKTQHKKMSNTNTTINMG